MPPHADAAEAARITGHRRFATMCDDAAPDFDPKRCDAYRPLVARIAAGEDWPPAPDPQLPALPTRAANLARAAVAHVRTGARRLDDEATRARLAVCAPCPERLPNGACAGCGCAVKRKARWAEQLCPAGKWPLARVLPPEAEAALAAAPVARYESLAWLRRYAEQGRDPAADVARFTGTRPTPETGALPVFGWVHAAVMGDHWQEILAELLSTVERSGLLDHTARVFAGVVGPRADLTWLPDWVTVVSRDGPLGLGENSTIAALREWARGAPESHVWYCHTKGASRPGDANVTAWRDYLSYFTLIDWRTPRAALGGGYDVAGCDWTERDDAWFRRVGSRADEGMGPGHGFEGNYWWARSRYLADLPADRVTLDRTRWDAEWSFLGAGAPRALELHGPHLDLYRTHYPRARYDPTA